MSTRSTPGRRARMATTGRFVKPYEPMAQERLDEIRARVNAVRAPWIPAKPDKVYRTEGCGLVACGLAPEDVDLIAWAPDDLTDLLAEVERLRALTTVDQRGAYGYDGAPIQGRFTALQLAEMEDE